MAEAEAKERRAGEGRVGVIDIGSNSIRLVVFERLARAPVAVFNEKVMCGLGRGLEDTGKLDSDACDRAIANLRRFTALAAAMGVEKLEALATAAVRDARNGSGFVADVERECGFKTRVLSGAEEARLSALGVLAASPSADGAMGDLGGGSLELVELKRGQIARYATLPLGSLRVAAKAGDSRRKAKEMIERHLEAVSWLGQVEGKAFHPVGGAWRALARVHMEQANHPLHVIHDYELAWDDCEEFLQLVSRLSPSSLSKMYGVSRRRHETLPYAALLLIQLARLMKPERIVFSAFGLREGWLFDQLPATERQKDPLIATAADHARQIGRFGEDGAILADWCADLFSGAGEGQARLRRAACLLADVGWLDHPDYRAEHAFDRVLRLPVTAIDHPGRAFLATAIYARYGGAQDDAAMKLTKRLLAGEELRQAWILGLAMRLGLTLTGGTPTLLKDTNLVRKNGKVAIAAANPRAQTMVNGLLGEVAMRRFDALSRYLADKD